MPRRLLLLPVELRHAPSRRFQYLREGTPAAAGAWPQVVAHPSVLERSGGRWRARRLFPCLLLVACSCAVPGGHVGPLTGVTRCARTLKPLSDPDPKVNAYLQRYNFPADPFPWRLEPLGETEHFRVYHLTYPSPRVYQLAEANTVHGEYYLPQRLEGRAPAVVVLDILDGRLVVARLVCRHFAAAGIPSLIVKMPYYGERRPTGASLRSVFMDKPQRMLEAMEGTVVDVRRAACWLQARREVDPARIGILGVSLGGMVAALVAGVDPRFSRNVIVLGGGDPVGVLWHAPETREVRERLAALGYTPERLREEARSFDPLTFARRADPKTVLMMNAANDETVPRQSTMALWEAFGKPAIRWYPAGHYTMALFIPAILPSAAQFILDAPVERRTKPQP